MVTLPSPDRLEGLKQSLADFARQTYARRELVVVIHGQMPLPGDEAIKAHIDSLGRDDIRVIEPEGDLTLGALRNISKANARGEVFCQWDDDDRCHPERLERQLEALQDSGAEAACLQIVMQYFPAERRLYCTNYRQAPAGSSPGTIMGWTSSPIVYPERGEEARLGEDTAVLMQLRARAACHDIADAPHLYVYVSHGHNSWNAEHHRMLVERLGLSQGLLRRREAMLREGLSAYDFGVGPVTVQGLNGPAFTIG